MPAPSHAGVSVRIESSTSPEGTTATVNGKRVEPGEWSDDAGKGTFRTDGHASHVEYASTSGGGGASASARTSSGGGGDWSGGDEDEGARCSSGTVTQRGDDVFEHTQVRFSSARSAGVTCAQLRSAAAKSLAYV